MNVFQNELDQFDAIIHSIFDFDVDVVINECVELLKNNLFSSHLLDILYLNGKLQLNKYELGASSSSNAFNTPNFTSENSHVIHEYHIMEYATQLLNASSTSNSLSLYQTAFDYLLKCKNLEVKGIELIETHLEKFDLTNFSETTVNKVFHLAFEYDLHDLAFSIGRIMQMTAFKLRRYGTALSWNIRIKDASFGTFLAERILELFFETNDVSLLELTENLSKEIIYCDRLIFLSKFKTFRLNSWAILNAKFH